MSDAQRRGLRTLIQAVPAAVLVSGWNLFAPSNLQLNPAQLAFVVAIVTALLTFGQNWLEDNTSVPALLKAPASRGENPVPDDVDPSHRA
jgi:hypothetical protein